MNSITGSYRPGPLVVVGGTFDPPHVGHLVMAECAAHQFGAARVVFVPAGDPYKKSGSTGLAPAPHAPSAASHRLAMTALAIADNPRFSLDDRETRRAGPSYTVDTLESLANEGVGAMVLVLGEDAALDFATWKTPERILALATVAVAPKVHRDGEGFVVNPPIVALEMPLLEVSSTVVRERVRNGEPIRYLVPGPVEAYIAAQGLYRA